jgi:hypothetical protein
MALTSIPPVGGAHGGKWQDCAYSFTMHDSRSEPIFTKAGRPSRIQIIFVLISLLDRQYVIDMWPGDPTCLRP